MIDTHFFLNSSKLIDILHKKLSETLATIDVCPIHRLSTIIQEDKSK